MDLDDKTRLATGIQSEYGTIKGRGVSSMASEEEILYKCFHELRHILGMCLGFDFGVGVNIIKMRGDMPVPKEHAGKLKNLAAELHQVGGKTRFRVHKNRLHRTKSYVDLFKRLADRLFGRGAFILKRRQKINAGKQKGKRIQKHVYTYLWTKEMPCA